MIIEIPKVTTQLHSRTFYVVKIVFIDSNGYDEISYLDRRSLTNETNILEAEWFATEEEAGKAALCNCALLLTDDCYNVYIQEIELNY